MTIKLNTLSPNKGANKKVMRVGRGIGSGKGKTCGRGGKGQTARSGVAINGFEGGQTPIHRRLPKRGFSNPTNKEFNVVNLEQVQLLIEAKRIDAKQPITRELLVKSGVSLQRTKGLKILGVGVVTSKVEIIADAFSDTAKKAIEAAGGKTTVKITVKKDAQKSKNNITETKTKEAKPVRQKKAA